MTTKVTSITEARTAARRRSEAAKANGRTVTALMAVAAALLVIGITATASASSAVGLADRADPWFFLKRQVLGAVVGAIALAITVRLDYRIYRRLAVPIYLAAVALLVLVLVAGISVNGSKRWLSLGPFTLQVSEFAKFAVIVALAAVLDKKRRLLGDFGHFLAPVAVILGIVGLGVMLEPDLGTTVVIAAAGLAVMMASHAPTRFTLAVAGGSVAAGGVMALAEPYRFARITGFLDPWADAAGTGYQLIQGYLALGTGGLFGVGLGASRARWFFLPNAHTDFIFAIIGEETGLVGAAAVLALFLILTLAGWAVSSRAPDDFGRMLAAGITAWFAVQAIVNIGGVLGVMPITGITLPFVSYGSSALVVSMAALGVLANIAQHGRGARVRS